MKRFVVATTNSFDNILTQKLVEAKDWKGALKQIWPDYDFSDAEDDTMEAWKVEAFNGDCMFDVLEIPS
jgi:hypothetical protein